eukprot:scaffold238168_cov28-Prasinocladus_malaysianus.AAC.1
MFAFWLFQICMQLPKWHQKGALTDLPRYQCRHTAAHTFSSAYALEISQVPYYISLKLMCETYTKPVQPGNDNFQRALDESRKIMKQALVWI